MPLPVRATACKCRNRRHRRWPPAPERTCRRRKTRSATSAIRGNSFPSAYSSCAVRAQAVKVDLLIEIQIGRGPLARARIARVPEPAAVAIPRHAPARGRAVHARNQIRQPLAGRDFKYRHRPVFAPAFRKRHRHQLSVQRRLIKVDGGGPARIEHVRIDDRARGIGIVRRSQRHQKRLQLRRLGLRSRTARRRAKPATKNESTSCCSVDSDAPRTRLGSAAGPDTHAYARSADRSICVPRHRADGSSQR